MEVDGAVAAGSIKTAVPVHPGQEMAGRVLLALGGIGLIVAIVRIFVIGRFSMGWDFLALVFGIALCACGPRAATIVRWLVVAWLPPTLVFALALCLAPPLDLTLTSIRLYPLDFLWTLLAAILPAVAMFWLLRVLPKPARARSSRIALALGVLTALFGIGMMVRMLGGADALRARDMVAEKYGNGYRYYTTSLNMVKNINGNEGTTISATVVVWNKGQVLTVPVQWRE
jgi:hypothetical protein